MRFAILTIAFLSLLVTGCLSGESGQENVKISSGSAESTKSEGRMLFLDPDESPIDYGWGEEAIQHYSAFKAALSIENLETARAELAKSANLRFGKHPLKDEWVEICFRITKDGSASFLDIIRFCELELHLLKDTDPKAYAKGIEVFQDALDQFNTTIKILEAQGQDPSEAKVEVKLPTP